MLPLVARPAAALALLLAVTACNAGAPEVDPAPAPEPLPVPTTPSGDAARPPDGSIAVLMPGAPRRTHGFGRTAFTRAVTAQCPDCAVTYLSAGRDPGAQAVQLADAVEAGARVLVLNAVDPFVVATLVGSVQESGVKVVGYDTVLEGIDAYVGLDREQVGRGQARTLVRALGPPGDLPPGIVMLNGSPSDPHAVEVKAAAHRVIDRSGAAVVGELDALPDEPRATARWLRTILAFYPPGVLAGVYAADDTLARLAVEALLDAGADPASLPPVTGAGATRPAVQRVLAGAQLMTVYRPLGPAAETTARVAVGALTGADPGRPTTETAGLPTYLLDPVVVRAADVAGTVVADGYWTAEQLCTRPLRRACARAGIGAGSGSGAG